jgi:hypothetical protein
MRTYGSKPRKISSTHLWDGKRDVPRRPVLGETTAGINERKTGLGGFVKGVVDWLSPKKTRPVIARRVSGKENKLSKRDERFSLSDDEDDANTSVESVATLVASTPKKEDKVLESKSGVDLLLQLCSREEIVVFSEYIDELLENAEVRKLGEASYSEVFTLRQSDGTTTVLKIVPFSDISEEKDVSTSNLEDILQEIRISRAMTNIDGFANFKGYTLIFQRLTLAR